jgi:hypothetical protein
MKKITGIFFVIAALAAGFYTLHASSTAGFNLSGAPGEGNCSSCHIGKTNPDSIGSINILVNGEDTSTYFTPNSTYDIEVISTHPGIVKFGFALNARYRGIEFNDAGNFLTAGDSGVLISDYVTHNTAGNNGNNLKSWKFKWKAPSQPEKNIIVLYAAAVMGNNDQESRGDKVYVDSLVLNSSSSTWVKANNKEALKVYQTALGWQLHTPVPIKTVKVINMHGQLEPIMLNTETEGIYLLQLLQPIRGIKLLTIETENECWSNKIIQF